MRLKATPGEKMSSGSVETLVSWGPAISSKKCHTLGRTARARGEYGEIGVGKEGEVTDKKRVKPLFLQGSLLRLDQISVVLFFVSFPLVLYPLFPFRGAQNKSAGGGGAGGGRGWWRTL